MKTLMVAYLLSAGFLAVSGAIGCFLDVKKKVEIAPLYWILGVLSLLPSLAYLFYQIKD